MRRNDPRIAGRLRRATRRFLRDAGGSAAIESMIVIMIICVAGVAMVDVGLARIASGRLASAAAETADLAARAGRLTGSMAAGGAPDSLGAVFDMGRRSAGAADFDADFRMSIGSFRASEGGVAANWIRGLGGGGAHSATAMTEGLNLPEDVDLIVVMAEKSYVPILLNGGSIMGSAGLPTRLRSRAVARPVFGALDHLE